jgi:hypothetical protein
MHETLERLPHLDFSPNNMLFATNPSQQQQLCMHLELLGSQSLPDPVHYK